MTCFHLYVCFVKGAYTCYGTMWWSKKNLKSVLFIYHVNSGDEVKLSSQRPQNSIFSYEIIVFNHMYLG